MKKILLILLVTLLAFTMVACRGEEEAEVYPAPEVEDQGSPEEDTDETDPINDEDEANGEETDREDENGEDPVGIDREEDEDGDLIRDPNLLTQEELDAMFGVETGIWDDEAFDIICSMEEELWELIDHLEHELERITDGSEDEDWIDRLFDQFDDFIESLYVQWDHLHEQFEAGQISSQDFIRGLEGVLQQARTYTFN